MSSFLIFKLLRSLFKAISTNKILVNNKFLKSIIRMLFNFIFVETEEKGYVKKSLKREFIKRRINLVDKAVNND